MARPIFSQSTPLRAEDATNPWGGADRPLPDDRDPGPAGTPCTAAWGSPGWRPGACPGAAWCTCARTDGRPHLRVRRHPPRRPLLPGPRRGRVRPQLPGRRPGRRPGPRPPVRRQGDAAPGDPPAGRRGPCATRPSRAWATCSTTWWSAGASWTAFWPDLRPDPGLPLCAPGLVRVDHLTNNVGPGELDGLVSFYRRVFGFTVTRTFTSRATLAPACAPRWCRAPTAG